MNLFDIEIQILSVKWTCLQCVRIEHFDWGYLLGFAKPPFFEAGFTVYKFINIH